MNNIKTDNIDIKTAAIINFISKYSNIIIQLIINSVLARVLTPDDYGIVAIITVFISFFTIIADMGIGPAIIQYKDLRKREISDIFKFTFFMGIITSGSFIVFSYPLYKFYDNKIYISLGIMLSVGIFFNVLNIVPNALLLKEKQFQILGIRTVIITVISGAITIYMALLGYKYYALVANSILIAFFMFLFNYFHCKIKIYPYFCYKSIKKIKRFSSYQFGFNFINYFSRNLDNLLIGKIIGQVSLGYYDKAYKLMLYPVQNLTHVITPVLHPILSEYQNDREKIYNKYIKIVRLLSIIGVFFSVFCFFTSNEIIIIMFGNQWGNSVKSFKILSISICIQMVLSSSGTIFQATNETKKLFLAGIIGSASNVLAILLGVILGSIEYVSLGIVIAYIINFITGFYLLINKVFNKSLFQFFKEFISTIIIAIICCSLLVICNINIDNILLSAIYKFLVCFIGYILGIVLTKEYKFISEILKRK